MREFRDIYIYNQTIYPGSRKTIYATHSIHFLMLVLSKIYPRVQNMHMQLETWNQLTINPTNSITLNFKL